MKQTAHELCISKWEKKLIRNIAYKETFDKLYSGWGRSALDTHIKTLEEVIKDLKRFKP